MLPAARALVRSSWIPIRRIPTGKQTKLRPYPPGARHGTTLSLRHVHSVVESPGSTDRQETGSSGFPVDVIDIQRSLSTIEELLKDGDVIHASQVLCDVLVSRAAEGDIVVFHKVKDILEGLAEANASLLMQLGIAYASYGHGELVKDEILPLVRQVGAPEWCTQFELDVEKAMEAYQAAEHSNAIFEDNLEDYTISTTAPATPKMSTMAVIEQTLPALLPQQRPNDGLVFECGEVTYSHIRVEARRKRHAPSTACRILGNLVTTADYPAAWQLLQEMKTLGIPVKHARKYRYAAQEAIRNPHFTPAEQLEHFTTWLSLIPAYHQSKSSTRSSTNYKELFTLVTQAPIVNPAFVIRLGVIMASKGYADLAAQRVIRILVRFTGPEVWKPFLRDFARANEEFCLTKRPRQAKEEINALTTYICRLVSTSLISAGKYEEAAEFLSAEPNSKIQLPKHVYGGILDHLEATNNASAKKIIPMVERLRDQAPTFLRSSNVSVDWSFSSSESGIDLAGSLRSLKQALSSPRNRIPHIYVVFNIINAYIATGKRRAVTLLYNKALRLQHRTGLSVFLHAEMLLYRRIKRYDLVIETYADHFFLSTVPRDIVLHHVRRLKHHRRNYNPDIDDYPPPSRRLYDITKAPSPYKIWSLSSHSNLVWDALVQLTRDGEALENLYHRLLDLARNQRDIGVDSTINAIQPLRNPAGADGPISSGAFLPFMPRLAMRGGPERAAQILRDMVEVGVSPTIYHYGQLAVSYALRRQPTQVFLILDRLEESWRTHHAGQDMTSEDESRDQRSSEASPSSDAPPFELPRLNLAFYRLLMHNFLVVNNLEAAERVARQLEAIHPYTAGEDPSLDVVYEQMRERRGIVEGVSKEP